MRVVSRPQFQHNGFGQDAGLLGLCLCVVLMGQFMSPGSGHSAPSSITAIQFSADQSNVVKSQLPIKPLNESPPAQPAVQEPKSAQSKQQISKSEETRTRKDSGEEGAEKESTGRKAVSSLILTVKLALLEDPRLFPYEIEVEAGSDEVTLMGKVSTETEKIAAGKIASTVPIVKSVSNKLEVVKELSEVIARKQDDIITQHVKERFAKSATVSAANFDVKTEQGVVSLSGTVRFQVIVFEAAEAARQVPGVKAVKTDKVKIESEG
ncbi:MAG TPA: BON domain-containing protein [Nitrospiraceae bacterium]|nr:BON domain-containing protein [Nitrospiraceae bacterium]